MIAFFRRSLSSWFALALFGIVLLAFIVTGVVTKEMGSIGGGGGGTIAKIGRETIDANEVSRRVQLAIENARQQTPGLDMAAFVAGGGVEQVIGQYLDEHTVVLWGRKHGIGASDRLVDGEIASIPAFAGPTGRFDPLIMRAMLGQRHISERDLREDIAAGAVRRQLLIPVAAGATVPDGLIVPYASLLLEAREGQVGIVPAAAIPAGPAPTDAEIAAWYKGHLARYTVPEQRVLRYALFGREQVKPAAPTEAEIAAFYQQNRAAYAAKDTRTLSQVILPDRKAADAFAAKVKGGASFDEAARQAGFTPQDTKLGEIGHDALAGKASRAVADAAYAAPAGGITAPVKADLGWYVVKVDAVKAVPARPLSAVHAEIADALTKQKADEALSDLVGKIEDAVSNGSNFDEVAKAQGLNVVTTPPLLANGTAPDQPGYKAPPEMPLLLKSGFQASIDDDPSVETIGAGAQYALLKLTKVIPAAPAPLARVHDDVVHDIQAQRASDRAKAIAQAVLAKVKAGTPMAQALAASGLKLPPPQKAAARQIDLQRNGQKVPRPLVLLFTMKQGDTGIVSDETGSVWFVVHLDQVVPGDAATQPQLVAQTRDEFARMVGQEYAEQFTAAAAQELGVKRYPKAIAQLKARLAGNGGGAAEQ